VLSPDGTVRLGLGDIRSPVFPRSTNKLMQAAALLGAGVELTAPAIAMAAASHAGSPGHQRVVQEMLASGGLDETALGNPPDWPLDDAVRDDLVRAGGRPSRLAMNCSGKHAAMLLTCLVNGWPTEGYLDPGHEVQLACRRTVEELAGERVRSVGVDGCGAPLLALSPVALARAYQRAVCGPPASAERRVADAMRAWPQQVSGEGRFVTEAMRAVPGLLVKDGAEGVCAGALPDGTAFAFKIEDGAARAVPVVACAVLRWLGVTASALDSLGEAPLLGGGRLVGEVRAAPGLFPGD
jgi:L-asparaginase II